MQRDSTRSKIRLLPELRFAVWFSSVMNLAPQRLHVTKALFSSMFAHRDRLESSKQPVLFSTLTPDALG
jgi:hypothetical protein